ncbi:DUF2231 domain-containing protein [Lysobacter korlensis]|uniref:DUF2231 domain-containing protein n=1 Tax=Lysobacter korlensis TaxID=553636 RepID=A0ABV6RN39_9GAMM
MPAFDYEVNGLPLHILVVHAVVVFVPLAAVSVLLAAAWPAARRRLGLLPAALATVALALVPVTTAAGEWLKARLPSAPLIEQHAALGDDLLPWSIAVFVVAVLLWLYDRFRPRLAERMPPGVVRAVPWVLLVLAFAAAVGSLITVVVIGESGARAVWQGTYSPDPLPR